jgi:hypothetical protein
VHVSKTPKALVFPVDHPLATGASKLSIPDYPGGVEGVHFERWADPGVLRERVALGPQIYQVLQLAFKSRGFSSIKLLVSVKKVKVIDGHFLLSAKKGV